MANNNPATPEQPDDKINGIISELKQFLSEIKSEKPVAASTPTEIPDPEKSVDIFTSRDITPPPMPMAPESEPIIPPVFSDKPLGSNLKSNGTQNGNHGFPDESSNLPSDSEFWNGNVLGWDSSVSTPSKSESVPYFKEDAIPETAVPTPPPAPEKISFSFSDIQSYSSPSAPAPEKKPVPETPPFEVPMPSFLGQPQPESDPSIDSPFVANEPAATSEKITPPEIPPTIEPVEVSHSKVREISMPNIEVPAPPESVPPIAVPTTPVPEAVHLDLHAPLPGNVDANLNEKKNEFEGIGSEKKLEMKPDHVVHAACIIPSQNKADGQYFFNKLREVAGKSKNKLEIEAVFIHEWSQNSIDIEAWEKSAVLSGADAMFIVAGRDDHPKFLPLIAQSKNSLLKKYMVKLEQVKLQNLYAELVYQLSRKG